MPLAQDANPDVLIPRAASSRETEVDLFIYYASDIQSGGLVCAAAPSAALGTSAPSGPCGPAALRGPAHSDPNCRLAMIDWLGAVRRCVAMLGTSRAQEVQHQHRHQSRRNQMTCQTWRGSSENEKADCGEKRAISGRIEKGVFIFFLAQTWQMGHEHFKLFTLPCIRGCNGMSVWREDGAESAKHKRKV